jgi:hypothetical protein
MVNPAALLLVGVITGIGGAATYAAFNYAQKITSNERSPTMKTEEERKSAHEQIFGKGSTSPLERLGRGQTVNDLLPMPPEQGPPLPRGLALRWPWKK